jgi:hypothetical protein
MLLPKSLFLAHAPTDHEFARALSRFLEFGCNVTCSPEEGLIEPGEDLLAKAEQGLASDVLILLLSEHSWTTRWPRERWEPILFAQTQQSGVETAAILLGDCPFPPLLRRKNFFDAAAAPKTAMRILKRWLWQGQRGAAHSLNPAVAADLEELYSNLSDEAGTLRASGAEAERFAKEASQEFEAVLWVPCHRRTVAQIAGELARQLRLVLEGTTEQNCCAIQNLLSTRRCLLVLDAPAPEKASALIPHGRTSTLITTEPVNILETPDTLAHARKLIGGRRYAEAYELLYRLLDVDVSASDCAHELSWICERWNRIDESLSLRSYYRLPPTEQLSLF